MGSTRRRERRTLAQQGGHKGLRGGRGKGGEDPSRLGSWNHTPGLTTDGQNPQTGGGLRCRKNADLALVPLCAGGSLRSFHR